MNIRRIFKQSRRTSEPRLHTPEEQPTACSHATRSRAKQTLLLTLTLAGSLATSASVAQQRSFDLYTRDGLVTLKANNAPVVQLADALAQELNINVVISGDDAGSISADIVDEPVEKALALLSPNHMLVREDSSPDARIIEVVLMLDDTGSSNTSVGEFLPSGDPTEAIVPDEELMNANPASSIAENVEQGIEELRDSMLELEAQQGQNGSINAQSQVGGAVRMDPPPAGFDPAN